jgi:Zn-dependent protease
LPEGSAQSKWVREHIRTLEQSAATLDGHNKKKALGKLAPLGALGVLLAKLLKLKFLFSLVAFMGVYWALWGARFGIGFAIQILIHEMGHYIDIKRRGLPAEMPVFLPGLGAYVKWQALGVPLETRAAVSLAGPLAGFLAALACAALWWQTGNPFWAALARVGAILNLLNLIPVWVLDGGQAALALSKAERIVLLIASVALGLVLGERLFFLVALGAGYRAFFSADLPAHPSHATTIYYVVVLTALGVIIYLMPGHGFGLQ